MGDHSLMERDYVLGTHDEELARLGLQHRVWRPVVLDCWQKAGITVGKRVLDVGAGPGYATVDLAEIVGPTGEVVALERSANFVKRNERNVSRAFAHEREDSRAGFDDRRFTERRLRLFLVPLGAFVCIRSGAVN